MAYRILRGRNQIGGTITEVSTEKTRVFIDFGAELAVAPGQSTDGAMIEMIQENPPDAILFSHIHGDHVGLLYAVPDSVTVYMGRVARIVLLNIRKQLLNSENIAPAEREKLQREYDILKDDDRVIEFTEGEEMPIGDMAFVPYYVDHSVCDAYMFKLKVEDEILLHTGDFRNHGILHSDIVERLKNEIMTEPVDILITEGTMMKEEGIENTETLDDENEKNRNGEVGKKTAIKQLKTLDEVQDRVAQLMLERKYAFLIGSSTNMQGLSAYQQAMLRSGRENGEWSGKKLRSPFFVANHYVIKQLNVFRREYGIPMKDNKFKFARCYPIQDSLKRVLPDNRTQKEHMLNEGFLMMVGTSEYYQNLMEEFREYKPIVFYDMWKGYLEKGAIYADDTLIEIRRKWGDDFICDLHTSGHASVELLEKVINTVSPRKVIVPIHTENGKGFLNLNIKAELKEKIVIEDYK